MENMVERKFTIYDFLTVGQLIIPAILIVLERVIMGFMELLRVIF